VVILDPALGQLKSDSSKMNIFEFEIASQVLEKRTKISGYLASFDMLF
jgi:hypothetical protein